MFLEKVKTIFLMMVSVLITEYNNINVGSFFIKLLGSPSYDIDFENQEIKFEINELNQKIVVTSDEIIKGWSFIVEDTVSDLLQSRSDKNLLTGCFNFS